MHLQYFDALYQYTGASSDVSNDRRIDIFNHIPILIQKPSYMFQKPNDKNEEDAEDEMIKEGGKNQEPELAMEEFIEETETEIENDYEER